MDFFTWESKIMDLTKQWYEVKKRDGFVSCKYKVFHFLYGLSVITIFRKC